MAAAGPHATSTVPVRPRTERTALIVWRFGPAVLLMAIIWWLSAQPHLKTDLGWIDMVLRKCAHVTEFALLTLLWARALRWGAAPLRSLGWRSSSRGGLLSPGAAIAGAALIACTWAVVDETHQHFVSGRVGSPRDVVIDSVGVAIAARAWWFHYRTRDRG